MKSKEFIIERVDLGDGVIPLARYEVRQNVGDGKHKTFEAVAGADRAYMGDAVKSVLALAMRGGSSSDLKMAKITILVDKEGSKHGKV